MEPTKIAKGSRLGSWLTWKPLGLPLGVSSLVLRLSVVGSRLVVVVGNSWMDVCWLLLRPSLVQSGLGFF